MPTVNPPPIALTILRRGEVLRHALREIAQRRRVTIQQMIGMIDADRKQNNLSSAIRLFVLSVYQDHLAPPRELDAGVVDVAWPVAARR